MQSGSFRTIIEKLCVLASSVILWIGVWDLVELLLPHGWQWRVLLVVLSLGGLVCAYRGAGKSIPDAQSSAQPATPSSKMDAEGNHSSGRPPKGRRRGGKWVELMPSADDEAGDQVGRLPTEESAARAGAHADNPADVNGVRGPTRVAADPEITEHRGGDPEAQGGDPEKADDRGSDDRGSLELNARSSTARELTWCGRCQKAGLLMLGVLFWIGMWDLLDDHALPTLTRACNRAAVSPGPRKLIDSPACVAIKLAFAVVGALGLWCTLGEAALED